VSEVLTPLTMISHREHLHRNYGIHTTLFEALEVATEVTGRRIISDEQHGEKVVRFHHPYTLPPSVPQAQLTDACISITRITAAEGGHFSGFNEIGTGCTNARNTHNYHPSNLEDRSTRIQIRALEYTNRPGLPENTIPPPQMPHPWQNLPPPNQYYYFVITLPSIIPTSNQHPAISDRLWMTTIRGMYTDLHHACLLATYLMGITIVVSPTGHEFVDKVGTTLIEWDDWMTHPEVNYQYPATNTIGRVSIIFLPKNLFGSASGASLYNLHYLQGNTHYVRIAQSTTHFNQIDGSPPNHDPLNPATP
jgi:hypothetical protein